MQSVELGRFTVGDMMVRNVCTISPEATLSEALGKMQSEKVRELVVVKDGKLKGLLDYDLMIKRMNLPLNTKIENLLTLPPRLSPDSSIIQAAETLISAGLRAAPVTTDDNKVLGLLSRSDIVKLIPKFDDLRTESVGSVMSHEPVCVAEGDSIEKAKELMRRFDEPTIPVIDSRGFLSGVVDIRDIGPVMLFKPSRQRHETESKRSRVKLEIKSVMRQPVSVPLGSPVGPAVELMLRSNLPSIVVTANDKPAGILTQSDLIEMIARRRDEDQVYVQITGLSDADPFLYESLYGIIEKAMKRVAKMAKPQMFVVHVSQYNPAGTTSKFSLRARLNTERKLYFAQAVEWDLMRACDTLMRELEGLIRKDHEIFIDRKKKPRMNSKLAKFGE